MASELGYLLSDWLRQHQQGTLDLELGDALRQLNEAVMRQDKPGAVTLTIKVNPAKGMGVGVAAECGLKLPKQDIDESFYFVDHSGQLTRRDPVNQPVPGLESAQQELQS